MSLIRALGTIAAVMFMLTVIACTLAVTGISMPLRLAWRGIAWLWRHFRDRDFDWLGDHIETTSRKTGRKTWR